ncbi:nucleolar protein 11-like [Glandiceps talaboti]
MAALREGYELCSVTGEKDFIGVTVDRDDIDTVIVTSKKNITAYKLSHQKAIHSWSSKSSQTFTCPVTQNPQTQEYIAVQQNKILRLWKTDDIDVNKWKKYQLSQPVHKILTCNHRQPVLLYENGTVQELQTVLENPKLSQDGVLGSEESIVSAQLVDGDRVIVVIQHGKTHNITVIVHNIANDEAQDNIRTQKFQLEKPNDVTASQQCLCHCVHQGDKTMSLFSLWSNGCVYRNEIPGSPSSSSSLQTSTQLFTVQGIQKDSSVAMTALNDSYVVVVGTKDNQSKEFLTVWDVSYGTLHCKQEINSSATKSKVSKHQQLFTAGSNILTLVGKSLMVYAYTLAPSTLAGVLGRSLKTDSVPVVQSIVPFSAWKVELVTETDNLSSTKGRGKNQDAVDALIGRLMDDSQTKTSEDFQSTFEELIKLKVDKDKLLYMTPVLLQYIVKRTSNEPDFWPSSSIELLITKNQISASSCVELFQCLINRKDLSMIHLCIEQMTDIPEKTLISCLQLYLSVKEDSIFDDVMTKRKLPKLVRKLPSSGCPLHKCKAAFITQIMHCPQNDVFLIDHLRKLAFEEVMDFLKYLCYLLEKAPVCQEEGVVPTLEKVVEWLCILLDAQFTQLVIVPEAKDLLIQLQQQVEDQAQFFKELGSLESVLQNLKSSIHVKPVKKQEDTSLYRIEILKL